MGLAEPQRTDVSGAGSTRSGRACGAPWIRDNGAMNRDESSPARDLDARGLLCPEPIRLAEQAIRELSPGALLRVHATDPAAPIDFEAWCLRRRHEFLACEAQTEGWVIRVRKGAA